ncbi:MAG: transglycosylase SLT domain-containing protein [Acidimicrobiia bacterium]
MRRLTSLVTGVLVVVVLFSIGFSGSGVSSTGSEPVSAQTVTTRPVSTTTTAPEPAAPALSEVVTEPPDSVGCRPVSPLVPPCGYPPGMVVGVLVGVERWRPLVERYFQPGDVDRALAVIRCESGGDPVAANPRSSARGLFQHLARLWPKRAAQAGRPGADIFDPEDNVAVAAWLVYHGGGWSHWNPSRSCW